MISLKYFFVLSSLGYTMPRIRFLGFIALLFISFVTHSDTAFVQRKDVQLFIKSMVKEHHFNERQLTATMSQIQLQPHIIESMEKPYEKKNWDVYKNLFLTAERVKGGIDFWQANRKTLEEAHKRYGVPPEMIVAILGVETLYGARQGNNRVIDALATLAFNYPKRSAYFTKELKEFLLLCQEHHVPATQYLGSYAGAMGKPQFMPSSYRYYAVDFHNTGRRDLMNDNADVIGSVANYFKKNGWKPNEGVAQHAQISGYRYRRLLINPRSANYHLSQLKAAGIRPVTASYNPPQHAGLIELITSEGKEYWMAYPNFFVITRYNSSPQYALVVYLLAQQLKMQWAQINQPANRAYV